MSQEGILNIGSLSGSKIEATMWFGPVRLKLVLKKKPDWQQLVEDTKLKVLSLTTKAENLNGG